MIAIGIASFFGDDGRLLYIKDASPEELEVAALRAIDHDGVVGPSACPIKDLQSLPSARRRLHHDTLEI